MEVGKVASTRSDASDSSEAGTVHGGMRCENRHDKQPQTTLACMCWTRAGVEGCTATIDDGNAAKMQSQSIQRVLLHFLCRVSVEALGSSVR